MFSAVHYRTFHWHHLECRCADCLYASLLRVFGALYLSWLATFIGILFDFVRAVSSYYLVLLAASSFPK